MRIWSWFATYRFHTFVIEGLISLCLAFILWLYMNSRTQQSIDHVQIAVQIQLAPTQRDQFALEVPTSPRVLVSFSGQNSRIRELRKKLQRSQVQASITYIVPEDKMNDATHNTTVSVEASHIDLPPGVLVEIVEPSAQVPITVHRIVERTLPVQLEYTGEARVSQIKLEPSTVLVRGPKTALDRADRIATLPYVITPPPEESDDPTVKDQVTVATELEGRVIQVTPRQVKMTCKVQSKKKWYRIADVPIHFLCPEQYAFRTRFAEDKLSKVSLKIVGPAGDEPPAVSAFIDLTAANLGRGRNVLPIRVQLPKEYQILEMVPPTLAFYLEEPEAAPDKALKEVPDK
jgi:hypothetical protein